MIFRDRSRRVYHWKFMLEELFEEAEKEGVVPVLYYFPGHDPELRLRSRTISMGIEIKTERVELGDE